MTDKKMNTFTEKRNLVMTFLILFQKVKSSMQCEEV